MGNGRRRWCRQRRGCSGRVHCQCDDCALVLSAWLVACTLICIGELTTGAVNRPSESTTPPVADHSTAMFAVLLTTALNCWVFPETRVVFKGDAEMLTLLPAPGLPPTERPPPQATRKIGAENIRYIAHVIGKPLRGNRRRLICGIPMPSSGGLQQVRKIT